MLAGVGGKTIAEAKENISLEEFRQWNTYREARGSLNPARRIDTAISKLTFYTLAIAGNKDIKLEDIIWWEKSITEDQNNNNQSSLEQMLLMLKNKASTDEEAKTTKTKFKRA